ncbi:MAG: shikimate dehydrogenase [Verrucomicrobia bacterium]|nr:shikimate dehydrogenase [Verrucomicrobiota bacterium]
MSFLRRAAPSARTRLLGVLGSPVRHSASPAMHNAALEVLELDWTYLAFEVHPDTLASTLRGARDLGVLGLNLTLPHKLLAMPLMDVLDDSAETYGAVNTVIYESQTSSGEWMPVGQLPEIRGPVRMRGANTDADALLRSLGEDLGIEPRSARILLLGAGGAARAAALRLADEGVGELWLVNRTTSKAEELAAEIRLRNPAVGVEVGYPSDTVDVVLNATSLGMKAGDPLPWDPARFSLDRADGVYDMVYRPAETVLLETARRSGCRTANGLGMLLYQGAAALELWTGRPAPVDAMRSALVSEVYGAP